MLPVNRNLVNTISITYLPTLLLLTYQVTPSNKSQYTAHFLFTLRIFLLSVNRNLVNIISSTYLPALVVLTYLVTPSNNPQYIAHFLFTLCIFLFTLRILLLLVNRNLVNIINSTYLHALLILTYLVTPSNNPPVHNTFFIHTSHFLITVCIFLLPVNRNLVNIISITY